MPTDNRTVEVAVHFFANDMDESPSGILPKNVWATGSVTVRANRRHQIPAQDSVMFNSRAEIPLAIEKALIKAGIKVHPSNREVKYAG